MTVGATYVKRSAATIGLVPSGVVTVTSTVPAPGGEIAVIELSESTVKLDALVEPNLTTVAPVNLAPVMVTEVPPVAGPVVGVNAVIVGIAIAELTRLVKFGDPQPVASSQPAVAGKPLLPVVMSWKSLE